MRKKIYLLNNVKGSKGWNNFPASFFNDVAQAGPELMMLLPQSLSAEYCVVTRKRQMKTAHGDTAI